MRNQTLKLGKIQTYRIFQQIKSLILSSTILPEIKTFRNLFQKPQSVLAEDKYK